MSNRTTERTQPVPTTVAVSGTIVANEPPSRTSVTTAVEFVDTLVSLTPFPVVLLAASITRLGGTIYNNSDGDMFVLLGTGGADPTLFTVKLIPDAYYELPFDWQGEVSAIWDTSTTTGTAMVTDLQP
jgi:hypothetical protein